jgi:hypothetical protein
MGFCCHWFEQRKYHPSESATGAFFSRTALIDGCQTKSSNLQRQESEDIMKIMLTDKHMLEYDGMGYTLQIRYDVPRMKKGKLEEFGIEGFYGNLDQVAHGLYRHEVHAAGIETVAELIRLQREFVDAVVSTVRAAIAIPTDFDEETGS